MKVYVNSLQTGHIAEFETDHVPRVGEHIKILGDRELLTRTVVCVTNYVTRNKPLHVIVEVTG